MESVWSDAVAIIGALSLKDRHSVSKWDRSEVLLLTTGVALDVMKSAVQTVLR